MFKIEKPANCDFVRYEHKGAFTVVGPQDQMLFPEIPVKLPIVVKKFLEKNTEIKNTKDSVGYGVSYDTSKEGFTYLFGKEVSKAEDLPEGFVTKEIPENDYAVISHKGSKEKLKDTYTWFYCSWMPENGQEHSAQPSFEVYDERYIPARPGVDTSQSYFEIYLPIKKNSQ